MRFNKLYKFAVEREACHEALQHIRLADNLNELVDTPYFDRWLGYISDFDTRIRHHVPYLNYKQAQFEAWQTYKMKIVEISVRAHDFSILHDRYLEANRSYQAKAITNRIILVQGLFNLLDLYDEKPAEAAIT